MASAAIRRFSLYLHRKGLSLPLNLGDFLPADDVNRIRDADSLAFHIVGDTGGVKFPKPQQIVSMKLAEDLNRTDGPKPAFMYILGDLIYFNAQASEYYPQFYERCASYTAPSWPSRETTTGTRSTPPSPPLRRSWRTSAP